MIQAAAPATRFSRLTADAILAAVGELPLERRLAVILAADVVGYSALMERDEAGTFERLKARRKDLFEPEIERHHGRIFKLMGDGHAGEADDPVEPHEPVPRRVSVASRRWPPRSVHQLPW